MAKGKAGPRPEMKVVSESGVTVIEEPFLDPTAEEIAGKENVVDVGSVDDPENKPQDNGYICSQAGCKFTTSHLTEMEEHVSGTGHGGYSVEAVQPELFSTPGVIHKIIEVPLDVEFLNQKRLALAELYQKVLDTKAEKKSADAEFNAELALFDERMQEIARVLQRPYTNETVDCEWRIIEGENARGLFRLDTGEQIDKQPLTQEDREKELAKATADNEQPVQA